MARFELEDEKRYRYETPTKDGKKFRGTLSANMKKRIAIISLLGITIGSLVGVDMIINREVAPVEPEPDYEITHVDAVSMEEARVYLVHQLGPLRTVSHAVNMHMPHTHNNFNGEMDAVASRSGFDNPNRVPDRANLIMNVPISSLDNFGVSFEEAINAQEHFINGVLNDVDPENIHFQDVRENLNELTRLRLDLELLQSQPGDTPDNALDHLKLQITQITQAAIRTLRNNDLTREYRMNTHFIYDPIENVATIVEEGPSLAA